MPGPELERQAVDMERPHNSRKRRPKRHPTANEQVNSSRFQSESDPAIIPPLPTTLSPVANGSSNSISNASNTSRVAAERHIGGINTRSFGGSLTKTTNRDDVQKSDSSSPLHADAPNFQPRKAMTQRKFTTTQAQSPTETRRRRPSRSNALDLTSRIHEDIDNRQYECPICTSEVLRHSRIWSCLSCWTVFHLACIKAWSSNIAATTHTPQIGQPIDSKFQRLWRCPGCNLPQELKPSEYTCWCGKDHDPTSVPGLPPHSCGQTCGKARIAPKKCPHPCESLCHAGPCPPCSALGPNQSCFCGKQTGSKRCIDTNYDMSWSCGTPCGDLMPCGEHICPKSCHEGLCGACQILLESRCYCGKDQKLISCCDRRQELQSSQIYLTDDGLEISETWAGVYECDRICNRNFDCGIHKCSKSCHSLHRSLSHCPYSPDMISTCPCGKSSLVDITTKPREKCSDPIPHCSKLCQQVLTCGHPCQQICHAGPCLPCLQTVTISCRCGRATSSTICHQGNENAPLCTRLCRTTLNCRRHECGEHCCTGERRATERSTSRRKSRPLNSAVLTTEENIEAEHICTRVCGRLLKCGNHNCNELCHKGPCNSCREAIFDELSCNCGRTVLQPPLPCGTKPPPCHYECDKITSCGHPQIPHDCHFDDVSCPKCPFLTDKACLCGKKMLRNQQCWCTDVHCGETCGKRLKCGSHNCQKTCHRPGECEDGNNACDQLCGKLRGMCKHVCDQPCHAPYPCNESFSCKSKIIISCPCQSNRQEVLCKASSSSGGNLHQTLECNEECARLERNRKLASALSIDPETRTDDHIPYSNDTLLFYQANVNWSQTQEREFRVFAQCEDEKRLRFKPMAGQQRQFIHHLAEDFGLDSESLDTEPHRHVVIFKSRRFVSAPAKTVGDCVRIRQKQQAMVTENRAMAKSSNIREPYNGFLLTSPRFALTIDEILTEIAAVQGPSPRLNFQIAFMPSDEVGIFAIKSIHTERTIDLVLKDLKLPLARAFKAQNLGSLQLCRFDASNNVTKRETDISSEGGWSQVAAKAAAPRQVTHIPAVGVKSSFMILGSPTKANTRNKVLRKEENIVEDWETAESLIELEEGNLSASPPLDLTCTDCAPSVNTPLTDANPI